MGRQAHFAAGVAPRQIAAAKSSANKASFSIRSGRARMRQCSTQPQVPFARNGGQEVASQAGASPSP